MRINTKIVIDIATNKVIDRESFEHPTGEPIAQCCGGGGGGDGGSTSAAGIAGDLGEGEIAGAAPAGETSSPAAAGFGGGMGDASVSAGPGGGMSAPGTAANAPGGGAASQVSFSKTGAEIGSLIGGLLGPGGAIVGGIVGGVTGSAIAGSGVPDGMDMSGDPTGGNAIGGPDIKSQQQRAIAGLTAKADEPKEGTPSLKDVTPDAKKEEQVKARKRPQTILTSPLGLRSKPGIRRATLLGG